MLIQAAPLTPAAFAPFGDVLATPDLPGRTYFDEALCNARPGARPSLSLSRLAPLPMLPMLARSLERHEHSSQTFVPLDVSRWLVIVAPPLPGGGPDASRVQAFVAGPGQGITYRADTWHHGLTVLDREARFAIFMWRDGSADDEEHVALAAPVTIAVPR